MKKNILLFVLLNWMTCFSMFAQTNLIGVDYDGSGNRYTVGQFEEGLDFSNNIKITSKATSIYIAKYDSKGVCQWATKIEGNADVGDISVMANGTFFLTGNISGEVKFGETKAKAGKELNLFVAKYNTSGDAIWIKMASTVDGSSGNSITTDKNGNIYILGTFNKKMVFDGQTLGTDGKNDFCVFKIATSGTLLWSTSCGNGKMSDDGCTISFINNKLLIGGNSIFENQPRFNGYIGQLDAGSGKLEWSTLAGNAKGNIQKIIADKTSSNYIVTGYVGGTETDGIISNDLYVSKINSTDGKAVWSKKYTGGNDKGIDVFCDATGNIYVTGTYEDSLRLDNIVLNGFAKCDIFIAKLNSAGKVLWAKGYGDDRRDVVTKLIVQNATLQVFGSFSNRIVFTKKELTAEKDAIFCASLDVQKMEFVTADVIAKQYANYSETEVPGIYGKLLKGSGTAQSFLNDQGVALENEKGDVIKKTITDEHGDFSFKNVDVNTKVNLILDKNENLKETDEVFLSEQNGKIIQKVPVAADKKFKYTLLPSTLVKMESYDDVDPNLKMKEFKTSVDLELTIIENILYPEGSSTIPAETYPRLNQIATYMRANQKLKLEIASHTDSNGDDNSNLILSDKRAKEVRDYIVKKGIQPERIVAQGFGETKILNRCVNNVVCDEKEHAFNRRTEFRILK